MKFTGNDILVLVLAVIILICALILMSTWIAECIQEYLRVCREEDMEDTIRFNWRDEEGEIDDDQ